MAIFRNDLTSDFITYTGYVKKKAIVDCLTQQDMVANDLLVVIDFTDIEALAVATADFVKVDADGVDTAIADGDNLKGYTVCYKATASVPAGSAVTGELEYWSAI